MTHALPKTFLAHLPKAQPLYTALYVHTFYEAQATLGKLTISPKALSQTFNVLETDIVSAFQYWQANLLIHLKFGQSLEIEFILEGETADEAQTPAQLPKNVVFLNATKPTYSPMELEMYKNKYGNIAHIFAIAEKALGRLLSANELSTLFGFYDWLRLPVDVIELLLQHCVSSNHRNMNYIEAIALDWSENNINTYELALGQIQNFNKNYRDILKALGQGSRDITTKEKKLIDKWLNDYQLPLEVVLEACDKTVMTISKPSLSYTESIIETWHSNNVRSLSDVAELERQFKSLKAAPTPNTTPAAPKAQVSKFANYSSSNAINYSELEDIEVGLMKNLLNG